MSDPNPYPTPQKPVGTARAPGDQRPGTTDLRGPGVVPTAAPELLDHSRVSHLDPYPLRKQRRGGKDPVGM